MVTDWFLARCDKRKGRASSAPDYQGVGWESGLSSIRGLICFSPLTTSLGPKDRSVMGRLILKVEKSIFFPFWVDDGPRLPEIILFLKLTCLFQNIHIFCPFFPVDFSLNALGQDFFLFRYRPADDRKIPKASSFT